jgi:hypothetical protein
MQKPLDDEILLLSMTIGKKPPKNHDSIWCPQCEGTNAGTLRQQRPIRRRGPGTREKVSLKRINLECSAYVHESNARNLPV